MSTHQPQKTEKSEPAVIRQDSADSLSEQDTHEGASVMNESTATPSAVDTTEEPAATHTLAGGQARFTLHARGPEDPGVVQLDCLTAGGDAVTLEMRHCQAQDLADWLFTSVDRIRAEEEDAEVAADEARLLANGGATLWTLGKVLAAEDGLTTETVFTLGDALDVSPVFLFDAITATRSGLPWSTMPAEDRLLRMSDIYVTAKTLGVQPSDIAATVLEATGEKGADDE